MHTQWVCMLFYKREPLINVGSAVITARRNILQRATKYVKYGGVEGLIKGKPLKTWGVKLIFHQDACLTELASTQCRILNEAEH